MRKQILKLGQRALSQQGYSVLAAATPGQALSLAAQHRGRVQLLITDVVMPGMNGKELKEQIESIQPGIQCLYMSGYTADVISSHGVLDDGLFFLQKPFTLRSLTTKVRQALDLNHG